MNKALNGVPIEETEARLAPQLTGRDLFKVLFRRKWIVLILFLSTSLFVTWNASRIPTEFRATAKVLLNRGMRNSALDRNISLLTWDETVNSELEIAESQPVIDRAQRILNEEAIEEGVETIVIDPGRVSSKLLSESNVIGIEYMSLNWLETQPVANAVARGYIQIHGDLFALPNVQEFFSTQVADAEQRLQELANRKQAVQEEAAMVRIGTQQDYVIRGISFTREALVGVERQYAASKADLDETRRLFYEENVEIPFDTRRNDDQVGMFRTVYLLRARMVEMEQQRQELLTRYTEQHPTVIALEDRIADIREEIRAESEKVIRIQEGNLAVIEAEATTLRREMQDLEGQLQAFPAAERELDNLDRSIDLTALEYQRLLDSRIQIGVSTVSSRDYTLNLLSEASSPVATNPRDPVRLALVPAFSLLVGISIAFFVETMDHSLKSREDVERHVELPVLASIPKRRRLRRA
ncbi:MAG: hypothetical protein ABIK65_01315 [Candidatus Eisenbacteria bacterium]